MPDRKKILVVDDDPNICLFCRTVLAADGHQVFTASTAREGLALMTAERPDLVILDVMMEEVDSGFQAAQQIASDHPGLPILMLSSIAGASANVFDTSQLPVAQLVDKPIDPAVLQRKVRQILG
jgi:DNA-binding response OmpR family regulator